MTSPGPDPIIIFGPTGDVGSYTALTIYEHYTSSVLGVTNEADVASPKIILAMRDPSKSIARLPSSTMFHRVRADLTDSASVTEAVKSTGAKRAFVYLVHPNNDALRGALTAMKDAGVEFVVFLSSFTIETRDINAMKAISQSDIIPFLHARVEVNLHEVFGPSGYVALRPGSFASNSKAWIGGIKKGEVELYRPDVQVDYITAKDMGRVCGRILVGEAPKEGNAVYLYGPELMSHSDGVGVISKVLGREIKVKALDEDGFLAEMAKHGRPEIFPKYMMKLFKTIENGKQTELKAGQSNVERYGGQRPTQFEEWVQDNKSLFE